MATFTTIYTLLAVLPTAALALCILLTVCVGLCTSNQQRRQYARSALRELLAALRDSRGGRPRR